MTVKTEEDTSFGSRVVKARNPLPCKTIMSILGMPSGPCRQPLGRMTEAGLKVVLEEIRRVYEANPWVLEPIENFFDIDIEERLYKEKYLKGLSYV